MKPEQFIREFGEKKARELLNADSDFKTYCLIDKSFWGESEGACSFCVDLDGLKRLVESLDLFKELKTKKNANREFMKACMRGQTERANQIKRAIEAQDAVFGKKVVSVHESIYGGGDES